MKISIIIKALNEEHNIARCLRSALAAVEAVDGGGEVILADSLSSDRTVDIAREFPVRIVQLTRAEDRCCGVGADLGYRVAVGEFLYILDADMTLSPDFLPVALREFDRDPGLAGVGGRIKEMHIDNAEFRGRASQKLAHFEPGPVDRLNMGGLYRRAAVDALGYLTNRNLHSFEEYELAARLRASGWSLRRIDVLAAQHYGHTDSSMRMLLRRWRSRYAWGLGELLRESVGHPHLPLVLREVRLVRQCLAVYLWWGSALVAAIAWSVGFASGWLVAAVGLLPLIVTSVKRRSLNDGLYVLVFNNMYALGLLAGVLSKQRGRPEEAPPTRLCGSGDGQG